MSETDDSELAAEPGLVRARVQNALVWAALPAAVAAQLQKYAVDLRLAYSANTLKAWKADWTVWKRFCERQCVPLLPIDLDLLRTFLLEGIEQGKARATLTRYLATLTAVHRLAVLPWVMDTKLGELMWRGLRREYLVAMQKQAQGLGENELERMQAAMQGGDEARAARDDALLSVAYEAMMRESELVVLQLGHFSIEADGSGLVLLAKRKTDQEGEGVVKYLTPETVLKVQRWISLAGIEDGPLFRSAPRSNKSDRFRNPLNVRDVDRIMKRRATAAGINASRVSGHSTRVGATQDLLEAGFTGAEVMQQGDWKTERMVLRYGENIAARRGAMARFKGKGAKQKKGPTEVAGPEGEA